MLRPNIKPALRSSCLAGALVLTGAGLAQCDRGEVAPQPPTEAPAPVAVKIAPTGPAPTLTRSDVVTALAQAASAYASGTVATTDPLVGRTFAIRTAFGCAGPLAQGSQPPPGVAAAIWGPDRETVRLSLTPIDWAGSSLAGEAEPGVPWDAVEGLWVPRPWLASEACPAAQSAAPEDVVAPSIASPPTTGLAVVHRDDESRLQRRDGRPYSFTVRPRDDAPLTIPTRGYRLLLEGRIDAFSDGRATRCLSAGIDQRPVCVAAIRLDRVAFEDAEGRTLSEWRSG